VQNKKYCNCNRNPDINYDKENCCAHISFDLSFLASGFFCVLIT
jgi:hypothetical protein